MANSFNRVDSGFNAHQYQARGTNLADRHGQDSRPRRVQEKINSYHNILDWQALEEYLRDIWPDETKATLAPEKINDCWVFSAPRKLGNDERDKIAQIRDKKKRSQRQRRRSESPD